MSYGLRAALSWGISTLLAAVAALRIGALRTVVIGEAAGLRAGSGSGRCRRIGVLRPRRPGRPRRGHRAVSSAYPVIPLIGGLLLFREPMGRQQIGGAILILAGLVLVGLGS